MYPSRMEAAATPATSVNATTLLTMKSGYAIRKLLLPDDVAVNADKVMQNAWVGYFFLGNYPQ